LSPFVRRVRDFEYGTPGSYDYWRCASCGALTIAPMPDAQTLRAAYPPDYHAHRAPRGGLARRLKGRYWERKARRCVALVGKDARILDVGCGGGDLQLALRAQGVREVHGLDSDEGAVARVRAIGFPAWQGELGAVELPEGPYDLLVLTNVIEHFVDPGAALAACRSLLVAGGRIFGETPNYRSWDRRLFGRHWGGYHTPRHLVLFDSDSLAILAHRSGFLAEHVTNMIQPAHWALSLQNLYYGAQGRRSPSGGRSPLYALLLMAGMPFNLAQTLAVAARTTSVEFVFQRHE
jgi:2-polyprenyl-3-methyl-5-hydroxy-6-metoxy-1,4-benzoquinol methylase